MQKEGAAGEHGGDGTLEAILSEEEKAERGAGGQGKRREEVRREVEGMDGGDVAEIFHKQPEKALQLRPRE